MYLINNKCKFFTAEPVSDMQKKIELDLIGVWERGWKKDTTAKDQCDTYLQDVFE